MELPTISEYADTIADPAGLTRTLGDFVAQRNNYGEVDVHAGNNACVFRIECGGRKMMLKCYVRAREDLRSIYDNIGRSGDPLFPEMKFLRKELYVFDAFGKGKYHDVVAGEWIEGATLDTELKRACRECDIDRIERLSEAFDALALELLGRT